MATAIESFNKLQVGMESVKGTIVAATRLMQGKGVFREDQDFYRSAYPAGVLANVGGSGSIVRQGMGLDLESELSAEQVLWPLLTGIKGAVTGSVTDTTAYTWTFTPELATAVRTIDAMSMEIVRGDGTTNHYARKCGYGMTESFKFSWAFNQIAKMSAKIFARASQTSTPTAGLVVYTTNEPLISNLLKLYWDTTWAGLGGTQLSTIVRSADLEVVTGLAPDYTLDGRSDKDHTTHKVGPFKATLNLVLEFDATGAARSFTDYRSNLTPFIRLINTGSLAGAVTAVKTVRVDGAFRFVSPPAISEDGDQLLVSCALESVYDPTGTKTLEFVAINKLATVA